ncbi:MAG: hypothetical protein JNL25_02765 [Rhodospirillaceae bacterium]|nr:hypothetical protein [Rhodospirillaceae bacterium]
MSKMGAVAAAILLFGLIGPSGRSVAAEFSLCPPAILEKVSPESRLEPRCESYIWMTGEIASGDFEKFRRFLKENMATIVLGRSSQRAILIVKVSGKNYEEALRIGWLIRELELAVTLADRSNYELTNSDPPKPIWWVGEFAATDPSLMQCRGACVVVWLSGMPRLGSLGLILEEQPTSAAVVSLLSELQLPKSFTELWGAIPEGEEVEYDDPVAIHQLSNYPYDTVNTSCMGRPLILCKNYGEAERLMKLFSSALSQP